MTDHAVVIAGAGPTGLMLAGELALAGGDVAMRQLRFAARTNARRRCATQCPSSLASRSRAGISPL